MVVGQGVVQQHGHGLGRGLARKSRGDRLAPELHPHSAHRHIANLAVDACNVDVEGPEGDVGVASARMLEGCQEVRGMVVFAVARGVSVLTGRGCGLGRGSGRVGAPEEAEAVGPC